MDVHLLDGTYELFRHFFAVPSASDADGNEIGALRGVLGSIVYLLEEGATHVGVATDHVIESFRNELWPGYKTSEGVPPELLRQFHPLEDAMVALGVQVWPMVDLEADDALAAAAATAAADPAVRRVFICTPDKDLSQCVEGDRVVMLDRRSGTVRDEAGVIERFGVPPSSIPDWLALVGDSADGFPGVPSWGEKSAGRVLARYRHLEAIPRAVAEWDVEVRGAARLAESLFGNWDAALLFRQLATVRSSAPVLGSVAELAWQGPRPELEAIAEKLDAESILRRAQALAARRGVPAS
jgi:5'-3' exonuclease